MFVKSASIVTMVIPHFLMSAPAVFVRVFVTLCNRNPL